MADRGVEAISYERELGSVSGPPRFHKRPAKTAGSLQLHTDTVRRTALLDWRLAHQDESVVTIFAPAGYGKSTLLAQFAEQDRRPVTLISLEEADNDPVALVTHLAAALDQTANVDPAVLKRLRRPAISLWSTVVPQLGGLLASIERPFVLALDDLHLLRDRDCLDIIAVLCGYIPQGSQLMLAGREEPPLHLARLRAEGRLAGVRREQLAFDATEAQLLLSAAGTNLTESEVTELTQQAEGWPAGLYLTALSLRDGGAVDRGAPYRAAGTDRYIADYLREEILSRVTPDEVEFLTRTAVLDRMCASLCDAVLERTGSAAMLESLERSNRFVVALDSHDEWYRYHHLFGDLLARELESREPDVTPILKRRAADWYEGHGFPEAAIDYAFAYDDHQRAARLVTACVPAAYQSGRLETTCRWVDRIEQAGLLDQYPSIAVHGAWTHGLTGNPAKADRWATVAERSSGEESLPDGSPTIESWVATLSATMCRHGVEKMQADARRALDESADRSFLRPIASVMLGIAVMLAGDAQRADDLLAEAVDVAKELGEHDEHSLALAERSLLAAAHGDFASAEQLAEEAERVILDAGQDDYLTSAVTYAALGKAYLHRRDLPRARAHFARADRMRPLLTHFIPFLAVQVRLELIRARIAEGDAGGALVLQQEVDQLLRTVPALGLLVEQACELREQVKTMRDLGGDWAPLLTEAELRVLPLLATHLTMAEIAERQYVSRATVKTQAISIYRKLAVTKRSEAVERAVELGMIDSAAIPRGRTFALPG
jgi:LuxR family transcriptional regulator, maltose regulon positive regulatory protein